MKVATDFYALAKEILPQAKEGDPEAQYVLFKTYNDCQSYAWEADAPSLDAARTKAINLFPDLADKAVSMAESGYQKCHGFFTDDAKSLGNPWDWLQKATDAGYPVAQATTADQRLLQDHLKSFVKAGAVADGLASMPPIGGDSNPRDLLSAAVQSGDPDVLTEIGELQHMLNPQQPRDTMQINSTAWMYVGCEKGGDCSGYGPATLTNCGPNDRECTPVPQGFLSRVNYNWAPVQERVNQINAALNAKQWDQLPGLTTGG